MESTDKIVHKRLVSFTSPLFEYIKELGYELHTKEGHGSQERLTYKCGDKYIQITFHMLALYTISGNKPVYFYKGLTVHDELLKFFTKRELK